MKYKLFKDDNGNLVFESDKRQIAIPLKQISTYHMFGKAKSRFVAIPMSNGLPILLPGNEGKEICKAIIGLKTYKEKISFNKKKITKAYDYIEIKNIENRGYIAKKMSEFKIKYGPVVAKTIEKRNSLGKVYYSYTETM